MHFVKTVHHRVQGHAHTLLQGQLAIQRITDQFWNLFDRDDEEDKRKKKQAWRERFTDLKDVFVHGNAEDALNELLDVYDDEDLPDEISKALEPLVKELKRKRPELVSHLFTQVDKDYDIMLVEDGHDRTPPNPDYPTCTIVWKNGIWRHVEGTAAAVVEQLMEGARCAV